MSGKKYSKNKNWSAIIFLIFFGIFLFLVIPKIKMSESIAFEVNLIPYQVNEGGLSNIFIKVTNNYDKSIQIRKIEYKSDGEIIDHVDYNDSIILPGETLLSGFTIDSINLGEGIHKISVFLVYQSKNNILTIEKNLELEIFKFSSLICSKELRPNIKDNEVKICNDNGYCYLCSEHDYGRRISSYERGWSSKIDLQSAPSYKWAKCEQNTLRVPRCLSKDVLINCTYGCEVRNDWDICINESAKLKLPPLKYKSNSDCINPKYKLPLDT